MSLVRRLRGPQTEERSSVYPTRSFSELAEIVSANRATVGNAGTIKTALMHPTVWRCVNKTAGLFVQMPTHSYIGTRRVDPTPPVLADPSPGFHRLIAWKRAAVASMLLKGGVYGLTDEIGPTGSARMVNLIHPDRVDWTEQDGWTIDGEPAPPEWPLGNFWQVPYMVLPGSPKGVSAIEYARRTIYPGLAAAEFGGNFFRDGAHPTSVITAESDPGPDGAQVIKDKVRSAVSGTSRDPLVLPAGVSFEQIQINPEDSQFIEMMGFTAGQVAGFFGYQPEHVGLPIEGGGLQYSNRENRQQDVLQDAVMPVVLPIDEGLTLLVPDNQTARSSPEGLLRSDLKTRYESYKVSAEVEKATGKPILSHDEIRELEHREPLTDTTDEPSARDVAEMIQKIYLGVGVVVTEEEARDIINRGGAGVPAGPLPTEEDS